MQRGERYAPLGSPPGFVLASDVEAPSSEVARRLEHLTTRLPAALPRSVSSLMTQHADDNLFTPGPSERDALIPPLLRPGPGTAARFVLLYTLLTWSATLLLNLPWLPWLLWADYGLPVFSGSVPVLFVYFQTANFVFWNVLAVTASDDYCTHDCVDALRRLGVPHDRHSAIYRLACGWWPKEFWARTVTVTLSWTGVFGGGPLLFFLLSPPYHWERADKAWFVLFVTLWSSGVGATLSTLVCVRAAGEGTSSPFYVRTNSRVCFQPAVFKLAWRWSGVEEEIVAITRPPSSSFSSPHSSPMRLPRPEEGQEMGP